MLTAKWWFHFRINHPETKLSSKSLWVKLLIWEDVWEMSEVIDAIHCLGLKHVVFYAVPIFKYLFVYFTSLSQLPPLPSLLPLPSPSLLCSKCQSTQLPFLFRKGKDLSWISTKQGIPSCSKVWEGNPLWVIGCQEPTKE